MTTDWLGNAYILAREAHEGQVDKVGEPYIFHPLAVARDVRESGAGPIAEAAAVLHDTLEDTHLTADMLRAHGMPVMVVDAVEALTHRQGETRAAYYERVKGNLVALVVKAADIRHNLDESRLAQLDPPTASRLRTKYADARVNLGLGTT